MTNWLERFYWNAYTVWHARQESALAFRPIEELIALQNRRIRSMVEHAYKTVPFYRKALDEIGSSPSEIQTADDLALLPIIDGKQIAQDPDQFISRQSGRDQSVTLVSSGTIGSPKKISYDRAALFQALAAGQRQRAILAKNTGKLFGYREMDIVRRESISVVLRHFYESYSWVPGRMDFKRKLLSPTETFEKNISDMNAFKPDIIRGYGSYIGNIFRYAWSHQIPIHRPRAITYGADHLPLADQKLIEEHYGVPVHSSYQAAEALRIAYQCEQRKAFHVFVDQVAVRVVDRNGNSLPPGKTGEIIISNLTNHATVLLNYKLGDLVTLGNAPCPCGRSLPTITHLKGRADDLIVQPNGQRLHSTALLVSLQNVSGVVQVKVIQNKIHEFEIQTVANDRMDWDPIENGIINSMRQKLGDEIKVSVNQVPFILPEPNGKVRAVISHCLTKES